MKRDHRLRGLSSEHHHALTLARSVERAAPTWSRTDGAELQKRFDLELEPHFLVEEQVLLPALRNASQAELCTRTEQDHALLRSSASRAAHGDGAAAISFSAALIEHVRFEERDLFSACERLLPDDVLDEVARRTPKAP
jgi:hemerythrin-like domain-containing protein